MVHCVVFGCSNKTKTKRDIRLRFFRKMSLNKLPSTTVKLLSSSQVITSVSSVVKELIENSIDAGATNIEVKLENHGLKKIEVVDNGKGVKREDVWRMCLRSYTSKIRDFDDLSRLESYGFRGEALSSLCGVAKVRVTTKTEGDTVAMTYEFDAAGNVVGSKMSHINKGTIVVIEELFSQLPVRRQFLSSGKRKMEEMKRTEMTVKMLSVIQPRLRLSLRHNGLTVWQKSSVASLSQSLAQAIPPSVVRQLVDIRHTSQDNVKVQLLVPEKGCNISGACYKNPVEAIYLFINQRPVRDKHIEKLVESEICKYFGSEIPPDKHPTCLVSIIVPPHLVDVNLEPNKTRVLLKDREGICSILQKKLTDYYVGPLAPPEDFLQAIDSEISALTAEKRKTDDEMIQVRVKIPKLCESQQTKRDEDPVTSCKDVFLTDDTPAESTLKLKTETTMDISDTGNTDRDKIVEEFMNGLEEKPTEKVVHDGTKNGNVFAECLELSDPTLGKSCVENPSSDRNAPSSLDINSLTLSQWSRGDFKVEGTTVQSSTSVLGQTTVLPSLTENDKAQKREETLEIVNVDSFFETEEKRGDGDREDCERSVSSQMGCKEMAGFTRYASEMTEKIREESGGISFARVAGELVTNWRKLHDSEKEFYKDKPKTKPSNRSSKEKELTKAETSMRDQLEKFLARANEKKALRKRSYPKIVETPVTFSTVKTAFQRRLRHSSEEEGREERKEAGWRKVGEISEDIICLRRRGQGTTGPPPAAVSTGPDEDILHRPPSLDVTVKDSSPPEDTGPPLVFLSERRLAESLLFSNSLATSIVPYRTLSQYLPLTQESLGQSLWSVLVSLETAIDSRTGAVIVSDQRITSNGLRIQLAKDDSTGLCYFELTALPHSIPSFTQGDLKEILTLIEAGSPLEESRPSKVVNFIREETVGRIAGADFQTKGGCLLEKFQYWEARLQSTLGDSCPHGQSLCLSVALPPV